MVPDDFNECWYSPPFVNISPTKLQKLRFHWSTFKRFTNKSSYKSGTLPRKGTEILAGIWMNRTFPWFVYADIQYIENRCSHHFLNAQTAGSVRPPSHTPLWKFSQIYAFQKKRPGGMAKTGTSGTCQKTFTHAILSGNLSLKQHPNFSFNASSEGDFSPSLETASITMSNCCAS